MRILLVEDDDRVAIVDHLSKVDVVLLDLGLPDIDGVDVCRAICAASDLLVSRESRTPVGRVARCGAVVG